MRGWSFGSNRTLFAVACAALLAASATVAQVPSGSVRGVVVDESEGMIPRALITITSEETGLVRESKSNASGEFSVGSLPAGMYRVQAAANGFRTVVQTVGVHVGSETRVELQLPLGVLQQIVEAIDRIPRLDFDKQTVGGIVSRFEIQNLPLNGRDFLQLSVLAPGVVTSASTTLTSRQTDVSISGAPSQRTRF